VLVNRSSNFESLRHFPFDAIGKLTDSIDVSLSCFKMQTATVGLAPRRTFRDQLAAGVFIEPFAPEFGTVAVCSARAVFRLPVSVKSPVAGSYNSPLAELKPVESYPPAISTIPLGSSVAVAETRSVQASGGGEGPRGRVVQLRAGQGDAADAPGDQHHPVGE
jgi:hypothetical protein